MNALLELTHPASTLRFIVLHATGDADATFLSICMSTRAIDADTKSDLRIHNCILQVPAREQETR